MHIVAATHNISMSAEYLAGFFDGEGCIDVQRMYPETSGRRVFYCRPRVRIALADSGSIVIYALQAAFGGNVTYRKAQSDKQQASLSWEFLNREGMTKLLTAMLPYLILKKEQAKLALWWMDNFSGKRTKRGEEAKIEGARMLFAEELKLMKLDPQRLSEEAVSRIEALMR